MTRRWALAAALFLTATFGFLVVALGSQAGVFAWGRGADATSDAAAGAASPTPKPRIITEYVIVDPTPSADAAAQPADGGEPADAYEDGEHEGEHEDDEHEGEHRDDDHHDGDHEEHEEHDDD